jgi:hypothetical protein
MPSANTNTAVSTLFGPFGVGDELRQRDAAHDVLAAVLQVEAPLLVARVELERDLASCQPTAPATGPISNRAP